MCVHMIYVVSMILRQQCDPYCSAELELSSLKQRLDEATAVSQALRLELQLHQRLSQTTADDKENSRQPGTYQLCVGLLHLRTGIGSMH